MITTKQSKQVSSIGLDVDHHEIRAVQLVRSGGAVRVESWAVFPRLHSTPNSALMPSVQELEWVKSILGRRGFVGNQVSIAPQSSVCSSHNFELPPIESGAPLDQLARMEVARDRRCQPEAFELGHWSMPGRGKSRETLAVACPRETIDQMIAGYSQADLIPVGMDFKELAMVRAHLHTIESSQQEEQICGLLHVGWANSVAVICLGSQIVYIRRVDSGAEHAWNYLTSRCRLSERGANSLLSNAILPEELHNHHGVESMRHAAWAKPASMLSKELDTAIAYVSHSYRMAPIGDVLLSGYGTGESTIHDEVYSKIGTTVVNDQPPALREAISKVGVNELVGSRLTIAYGLAERFDQ